MTNFSMKSLLKPLSVTVLSVAALFAALPGLAQTAQKVPSRITAPIDDSNRLTLTGMSPGKEIKDNDLGKVDSSTPLGGMTLLFSRTPEQQADLDALVAAQQDIHSPLYHQWLSPEEFGARFGVSSEDIAKVSAWLQQKGFTVDRVARASNFIVFSGNAALVESAFGAPIHNYRLPDGTVSFAPSEHPSLPAAIAPTVQYIRGLNSFRKHSKIRKPMAQKKGSHPNFTNVNDYEGEYYALGPQDLATQYDINAAYKAGYTGNGQSIVVVGVSEVVPSDITNFQSISGVPTAKAPIYILVPNSGQPAYSPGDESESDLDLEYSSTIGKGAQVFFVYTGANYNNGTDDATQLAIDDKIAPIITTSYGDCEYYVYEYEEGGSTAYFTAEDAIYEQGVAQGQSLLNAVGDDGAVDCIEYGLPTTVGQTPYVDYPASSPYQTGMGATGFPQNDFNVDYPFGTSQVSTYWLSNTKGSSPIINSLIKPVPEVVWNDDDPSFGTSAGGGGCSLYETITGTDWQASTNLIGGVAIPTACTNKSGKNTVNGRMVPDLSLQGSNESPGLLVCSSDSSAWVTDQYGNPLQQGSCVNGSFYDATGDWLTIFGGTSFDGPIFSGMLAIINQALNADGLGLVNPTLYSIAENTTNYPLAFHDITVGSNSCYDYTFDDAEYGITGEAAPPAPMPLVCGVTSLAAGPSPPAEFNSLTGYDMASGLGSVDLFNLITAWPKPASYSLIGTITTVSAVTGTPLASASDTISITVASATGTTIPTGTVTIVTGAGTATTTTTGTLVTGGYSYSFASAILGTNLISVCYSGDTTHAASCGTIPLYVGTTAPPQTSAFTLTAANVSINPGSTGTTTVTVAAGTSYNGTVEFTFANSSTTSPLNICLSASPITVTSSTSGKATISIVTNTPSASCAAGTTPLLKRATGTLAKASPASKAPWKRAPLPAALAGLLIVLCIRRRSSLLRAGVSLALLVMLSFAGLGMTGCSSSSSANNGQSTPVTPVNPNATPAGTYTITVTGTDEASYYSITPLVYTTTFTLTVP